MYLFCGMSSIESVADKLPNLQIKLWLSDQSRLTLTPTQPNGTWAGPSPGLKSCWSKSLRRLGFLLPILALMVLLRLLRFFKIPLSSPKKRTTFKMSMRVQVILDRLFFSRLGPTNPCYMVTKEVRGGSTFATVVH